MVQYLKQLHAGYSVKEQDPENLFKNISIQENGMSRQIVINKILCIFIICFLLFPIVNIVNAQSDKAYAKKMENVYKEKTKELKKQKWQVSGTSLTLEAAVMKHLRAFQQDANKRELVSEVSMCKSMNVCKSVALNNALIEYAQSAGSYLRGRIESEMFNNSSADVPEEVDKFCAAYERLVSTAVKGELEFSFALEKANGSGKSYQAFYIINEEKASNSRISAMKQAFEETKLSPEYTNRVSGFVQEPFE